MLIDLDADAFDEVLSAYLRGCIESIGNNDGKLFEEGEKEKIIYAMKLTHDWFSKPSQWYFKD